MMRIFKFAFLIGLVFTGCTTVYIPSTITTPLPIEKNDYTLSVKTGITTADVSASYAFTDKYAGFINFSQVSRDNDEMINSSMLESAIGLYHPFKVKNNQFVFENYMGYGLYHVDNYMIDEDDHHKFDRVKGPYHKLFLQSDLGFRKKYFQASLAGRLSYLNLQSVAYPKYHDHEPRQALFFEPAFTISFGFENLKITSQTGMSFAISPEYVSNYDVLISSIGLQYSNKYFK